MEKKDQIKDQIVKDIEDVLETLRPRFMSHGGNIKFVRFENGFVFVKLEGACSNCSSACYTIKMLVEAELKKEIPFVKKVEAV